MLRRNNQEAWRAREAYESVGSRRARREEKIIRRDEVFQSLTALGFEESTSTELRLPFAKPEEPQPVGPKKVTRDRIPFSWRKSFIEDKIEGKTIASDNAYVDMVLESLAPDGNPLDFLTLDKDHRTRGESLLPQICTSAEIQ